MSLLILVVDINCDVCTGLFSTPGSRLPRATLQLPRKQQPLPPVSSPRTATAHFSSHRKPLRLLVPLKELLLFPQDKEDFSSVTSHEENWFVFSRSQRSSSPNNH